MSNTITNISGIVFNIIPYKDTEKVWNILTPEGIHAIYVRKPYSLQDALFLHAAFNVERSGKFQRLRMYEVIFMPHMQIHEHHYLRTLCSEVLYQVQIDFALYGKRKKAQALYELFTRSIRSKNSLEIEREVFMFLIQGYTLLGGNLSLLTCARSKRTDHIVLFLPSLGGFLSAESLTTKEQQQYSMYFNEEYQGFLRILSKMFRLYEQIIERGISDTEEQYITTLTTSPLFQHYFFNMMNDLIQAYNEYLGIELRSYRMYKLFCETSSLDER